MSRRRRGHPESGWIGPLIFAIVMGGVAYTVIQQNPSSVPSAIPSVPAAGTTVPDTSTSTEVLLGVAAPSAPSDKLFALKIPQGTFEARSVQPGWRITALKDGSLHLEVNAADDSLMLTDGNDWRVPIRARGGVAYQEVRYVGLFDPSRAALLARRSDGLVLVASRTGEVRDLVHVPDNANFLTFDEGKVWFTTFSPGEGIESPAQGPSTLFNFDSRGTTSTVATDPHLITDVLPGPDGSYAYLTDSGALSVHSALSVWTGDGKPLAWLSAQELLLAKGTAVYRLDVTSQQLTKLTDLPFAPTVGLMHL